MPITFTNDTSCLHIHTVHTCTYQFKTLHTEYILYELKLVQIQAVYSFVKIDLKKLQVKVYYKQKLFLLMSFT
jgi:hypothetical protein